LKSKEINVPVPSGSVIHVLSGGGGGWGDPAARDPAAREADAAEGLT
jgi:N-methylhydantoinase B